MIVYPAIDLIDGHCVRLVKGDFSQQTTYNIAPLDTARLYRAQGAAWLHLVDLDGARDPDKRQTPLVREIIGKSGLQVQTGGGIRLEKDVEVLLEAGADRVVIGSLAVKDRPLVKAMIAKFGAEKICLAVDVKPEGERYRVAVSGWRESADVMLEDLIRDYLDAGLVHVLCTDISRDGMMEGCNAALYARLGELFPTIKVQASGGVSTLDDIRALSCAGVVVGKALYMGAFTVAEALEASC